MICKFNTQNNNKKVIWEITNRCNYNCKYCIFNTRSNFYDLPLNICLDVIDDLISNGFDYIKFTGGEPFIRSDFFDILEYANGKISFDISTNASLITKESVSKLKNMNINFIHVSLDGTMNANDMLRGIGSYEKTIRGINLLKETSHYIRIGCVLFRYNQDELEEIVRVVENLGVNEIIFSIMEPFGSLNGDTSLNVTRNFSDISDEINNIKSSIKISYNWNEEINSNLFKCPAGKNILFIDNRGIVSPCTWISKITNKYNFSLQDYKLSEILKMYDINANCCLYDLETKK